MFLEEKIKKNTEERNVAANQYNEFRAEAESILSRENTSDEELKCAKELQGKMNECESKITKLDEQRSLYQKTLKGDLKPVAEVAKKSTKQDNSQDYRSKVNEYIRSKGTKRPEGLSTFEDGIVIPKEMFRAANSDAGIVSDDVSRLIPEEKSYSPIYKASSNTDLRSFLPVHKAPTKSGSVPVISNPLGRVPSVDELNDNPKLPKPEQTEIDYKVATYRSAIAIAQETLDDSSEDLLSLVVRHAKKMQLNTYNYAVVKKLSDFENKTVSSLDDLMKLDDEDLDMIYDENRCYIVSQSLFAEMKKIKDATGRPMLQPDVTQPTQNLFNGLPVYKLSDKVFGEKGTKVGFFGDIAQALMFIDRTQLTLSWERPDVYGKELAIYFRFDITQIDKDAGFFIKWDDKQAAKNPANESKAS